MPKPNTNGIVRKIVPGWGKFLGLILLVISCGVLVGEPQTSDITFDEVIDKFGVDSGLTDLQKKEEWEKYKGQCVRWQGKLESVSEHRSAEILLGFAHSYSQPSKYSPKRKVLVVAPSSFKQEALGLQKDEIYRYNLTLTGAGLGSGSTMFLGDLGCKEGRELVHLPPKK